MSTPAVDDEEADAGNEDLVLAARIAAVLGGGRAEARFNLEMFLLAAEQNMGGTLVIEVPSKRKRRERPEIRFASEGFQLHNAVSNVAFE